MSASRPGLVVSPRGNPSGGPVRLDLLTNPYGSSLHVLDVLAGRDDLFLPAGTEATRLRARLAQKFAVAADSLLLANGVEELLTAVFLWQRKKGPVVLFPPSDPDQGRRVALHGIEEIRVRRSPRFGLDLDLETASELPESAMAFVDSPNDPTGALLGSQEAVRLMRACRVVVVDERHAEYSGRTLVSLVPEFDNLLVLRTFETWAGLAWLPLAYAVGPPSIIRELASHGPVGGARLAGVLAALATLDDLGHVDATVRHVRAERSRLYRTLRKLNMVRPFPSWANFLLARIERGDPDVVTGELASRGILVHRPPHPELRDFIRVSATRAEHTDALRRALIEIAARL